MLITGFFAYGFANACIGSIQAYTPFSSSSTWLSLVNTATPSETHNPTSLLVAAALALLHYPLLPTDEAVSDWLSCAALQRFLNRPDG